LEERIVAGVVCVGFLDFENKLFMTLNYPLNLENIDTSIFTPKDFAFENLCKEYLEKKYKFENSFVLSDSDPYPWLEAPVVKCLNNQKRYWFQSKFSKNPKIELINSFFKGKDWKNFKKIDDFKNKLEKLEITSKLKDDDIDKINILYIFSKNDFYDDTKKLFIDAFNSIKKWITINFLLGKFFAEELRKVEYNSIRQKYYPDDNAREDLHKQNKEKGKVYKTINELRNNGYDIKEYDIWLVGKVKDEDKLRANSAHESFIFNKYMYVSSESFDKFQEIENMIATKKFTSIANHSKSNNKNFWNILEYCRNEIEKISDWKVHIKYFIPEDSHKEWLFIDFWAKWKIIFNFLDNKVLFIVKDNAWS